MSTKLREKNTNNEETILTKPDQSISSNESSFKIKITKKPVPDTPRGVLAE